VVKINRKLLAIGFIAIFAAVFFGYTRVNRPDISLVNGVYVNACCSNIIISGGSIRYNRTQYAYRLLRMKFGLTAYIDAKLRNSGMVRSNEPYAISFNEQGHSIVSLSVAVDGNEYTFRRISSE
jgi:hypothetical protein